MHVAAHRLQLATLLMFIMTTVAVLLHFVLHADWLLIFTAALPAIAAALHGIKVQLEFERLAASSKQMAAVLAEIVSAVEFASYSSETDYLQWLRLRSLIAGASTLLAGAANRWEDVVRHRRVGLPG